jgi:hypothetical protein
MIDESNQQAMAAQQVLLIQDQIRVIRRLFLLYQSRATALANGTSANQPRVYAIALN